MKITPREYYKCDYCDYKNDSPYEFKYTDNSGLRNQCFDMCSDDCFKEHLMFLNLFVFKHPERYDMDLDGVSIEDYIKLFIWINGKSYNCTTDNAKELFEKVIKWVKEFWDSI